MNWFRRNRSAATVVLGTLCLPAVLMLWLVGSSLHRALQYQDEINALEPRLARLRGLVAVSEPLENSAVKVDEAMLALVYPAQENPTAVAATLQKNSREIMVDAGLTVVDSRAIPAREEGELERIGVRLTVRGDVAAFDAALAMVAEYSPLLVLESVDIRPTRSTRGDPQQTVTAVLQLLALRSTS